MALLVCLGGLLAVDVAAQKPRVIVLGFDGVDHSMTQEYIAQGHLPNLKALAERGSFSRLGTTNPAESAVSWATFGCGVNPGHSSMFGFVSRRPGSYAPEPRFMDVGERPLTDFYDDAPGGGGGGSSWPLTLGGLAGGMVLGVILARVLRASRMMMQVLTLVLAIAGGAAGWVAGGGGAGGTSGEPPPDMVPTLLPVVEGKQLWHRLDESGVRVKGFLVPMATPIEELERGQMNGGLGVPDVSGSMGTFLVLTTSKKDVPVGTSRRTDAQGLVIRLTKKGDDWVGDLPGPEDRAREKEVTKRLDELAVELAQGGSGAARKEQRALQDEQKEGFVARLPVRVKRVSDGKIQVSIGDKTSTAAEGEWSDWMALPFDLRWPLNVTALARFRVVDAGDDIRLFFPPLGYDPRDLPKHMRIEHPHGFTKRVAEEAGLFDTTGWACVTNPLKDLEIDEGTFLQQIKLLTADRSKVVYSELAKDDYDFFFAMFGEPDRVQHMMYRLIDEENPMYDAELAKKYGSAILDAYKAMDDIVGEVVERFVDERTQLMVLSDHGFTSFRRQMAINTWLIKEGYLVPTRGGSDPKVMMRRLRRSEQDYLQYMNPSKSQAFALGLGKIYINLEGREASGIVEESEYDELCDEIKEKLLALRDPANGAKVINRVWRNDELYSGPYTKTDADLYIGFAPYYRVSWSTTSGGFSAEVIEDNDDKWSGGHASNDPDVVPGVLFSNRALAEGQTASIIDMAPTILALFGAPTDGLDGKALTFQ